MTAGSTAVPVSASLQGLAPKTVYYIRVVVWNSRGSDDADGLADHDQGRARGRHSRSGARAERDGADPAPAGTTPTTAETPAPTLGESMVVAPVEGTVKVREPGTGQFVVLGAGDSVPVGSVVDTRDGAVALTSELAGGRTQSATFGDGLFEVRQSAKRDGLTDIILRGGNFAACGGRSAGRGRAAAVTSAARKAAQAPAVGQGQRRALPHARTQQRGHGARDALGDDRHLRGHANHGDRGLGVGARPARASGPSSCARAGATWPAGAAERSRPARGPLSPLGFRRWTSPTSPPPSPAWTR